MLLLKELFKIHFEPSYHKFSFLNCKIELCLRNCFKLSQKRYVEFCLDRKCGGADFSKAATILGYTKN